MSPARIRLGQSPEPTRRPRKRWAVSVPVGMLLSALLAMPLVIVGLGLIPVPPVSATPPDTFTAKGAVALNDGDQLPQGSPCTAPAGYADVRQGAPVVIRDHTGKQVAVTGLDAGRADGTGRCVFTWSADGVPTTAGTFTADIAGRGTVTVTAPTAP